MLNSYFHQPQQYLKIVFDYSHPNEQKRLDLVGDQCVHEIKLLHFPISNRCTLTYECQGELYAFGQFSDLSQGETTWHQLALFLSLHRTKWQRFQKEHFLELLDRLAFKSKDGANSLDFNDVSLEGFPFVEDIADSTVLDPDLLLSLRDSFTGQRVPESIASFSAAYSFSFPSSSSSSYSSSSSSSSDTKGVSSFIIPAIEPGTGTLHFQRDELEWYRHLVTLEPPEGFSKDEWRAFVELRPCAKSISSKEYQDLLALGILRGELLSYIQVTLAITQEFEKAVESGQSTTNSLLKTNIKTLMNTIQSILKMIPKNKITAQRITLEKISAHTTHIDLWETQELVAVYDIATCVLYSIIWETYFAIFGLKYV